MARKIKSDKLLFLSTLLLVCASIVMVYSASQPIAMKKQLPQTDYLVKQARWVALGVLVLIGARKLDYRWLKDARVIWGLLGLSLVGLVVVLFMPQVKGAHRWIPLPGFNIQPSEFAKFAVVVFIAALLERRLPRINEVRYSLTPIAVVVGAIVVLVYEEPDAGSALVIATTVGVLVFAAGLSWRYLAGLACAMVPLVAVVLIAEPYRWERVLAFIDPFKDARGAGFQMIQSEMAVATGGLFGLGLGESVQKMYFLPEPHNDFIYAVISEEMGIIGATLIVLCFLVVIWRGLRIASRAQDVFASLLALGLTSLIGLQALVNISVVVGLLPTKGIALPLVSAGGSSLLVSMMMIGLLLNLSQNAAADA